MVRAGTDTCPTLSASDSRLAWPLQGTVGGRAPAFPSRGRRSSHQGRYRRGSQPWLTEGSGPSQSLAVISRGGKIPPKGPKRPTWLRLLRHSARRRLPPSPSSLGFKGSALRRHGPLKISGQEPPPPAAPSLVPSPGAAMRPWNASTPTWRHRAQAGLPGRRGRRALRPVAPNSGLIQNHPQKPRAGGPAVPTRSLVPTH